MRNKEFGKRKIDMLSLVLGAEARAKIRHDPRARRTVQLKQFVKKRQPPRETACLPRNCSFPLIDVPPKLSRSFLVAPYPEQVQCYHILFVATQASCE